VTPIRIRLREIRDEKDLSQQALADLAGVRQATISDLESGNAQGVKFETLERIARALGVEPGDLIERVPALRASRKAK